MLTLKRHSQLLHFDDHGFRDTPYVYRPLLKGKLYEEPFLEYVRSLARVGQYVDVGAHLGTHSIWFARMCRATHVHAFEPVGRYAAVARRNVAANSLGDRITVRQAGLAAERGRASNFMSIAHQIGFVDGAAEGVTETFEVYPMDDVVEGPVALIKIDVEGMETEVLRGASRILAEHRPQIFAEAQGRAHAKAIALELAPYGYQPTGRVFNASPTYEFSTDPVTRWSRARATKGGLLPVLRGVRRSAKTLYHRLRSK